MQQPEKEAVYYNALNIAHQGSYVRLSKLQEKYSTWENCWLSAHRDPQEPELQWEKLNQQGVTLILRRDKRFPRLLSEIPFPPHGLYIKGCLREEGPNIAIVGTRKATENGRAYAKKFSSELAVNGVGIISGLALGIDAAAHSGAIEINNGYTIAVIATGMNEIYPSVHKHLSEKILSRGGAIVSEYPIGTPALPYRFLERNRIISGLAEATLLIEAGERSGALATTRFALEQNRTVLVVPGPIEHSNYKGSNQLIRSGAELVTSPMEVMECLGIESPEAKRGSTNIGIIAPEEKIVLRVISESTIPLPVDKIIDLTHLKPQVVLQSLTYLIIKNIITEGPRGYIIN